MAGAVVLGIFALVYVQSAQNRANFSQITTLMSFREQVMTYYSSVVANRATWECTVRANAGLASALTSELSFTQQAARQGINAPDGYLSIRDYSGDCQAGFGGTLSGKLLIAEYDTHSDGSISGGLGLNLQDYNDLPIAQRDCDNSENGTHFCLRVEWESLAPDQGAYISSNNHAAEVKLVLTANRKAIKKDLGVNFDLKDKEHAIYMRRTVATDCGGGRSIGAGVSSYAGDYAVHLLDAMTGRVDCLIGGTGPLVVPPCYDMTDTSTNNPFLSDAGVAWDRSRGFGDLTSRVGLRCDGGGRTTQRANKGSCPRTLHGGTTAIAYFDTHTGIAQCSHPNILIEKVDTSRGSDYIKRHYCDGDNRFGIVRISNRGVFQCSWDRWRTNRGGVQPGPCSGNKAIRGFNDRGERICHSGRATPLMRGLSGAQGERGDSGRTVWAEYSRRCRANSRCTLSQRYSLGYGNYTSPHPTGPGVGRRGAIGVCKDCPSGCFSCYPSGTRREGNRTVVRYSRGWGCSS